MSSSQPDTEAAGPSTKDESDSGSIDLKILSPSPEVRNGLNFTSLLASTTVGQLKEKIRAELPSRPPNDRRRLIYRGRVMADESQTMSYIFGEDTVRQQKEHTLHLVIPETATHPGNTQPQRQTQTPMNPFQNFPHPGQVQNAASQANPFRNVVGDQRPASVPPMPGGRPAHTPVPNVPHMPGIHPHLAQMQAMQQHLLHLHQRAAGPNGSAQNHAPSHGQGQPGSQAQQGQAPPPNQAQSGIQPPQGDQNGQHTMAAGGLPGLPAMPAIPGNTGNFTRSTAGPHGETWTVTVNTTNTVPHGAHMPAQIPFQVPFPGPFQFPMGQVPGQNLQFGPFPADGRPHPAVANITQFVRGPVEAQMADLERFVQEQQRRVENFNPTPGDPAAREEGNRIRNNLQDAVTQLSALRARANNAIDDLSSGIPNPASLQLPHNNTRAPTDNSTPSSNTAQPDQQNRSSGQNNTNPQNQTVTTETSIPAPTVFLLSSPTGPEALLLSPAGTWTSPGASTHLMPLQQNDIHQHRFRNMTTNQPQLPMGNMFPQIHTAFNRPVFQANGPIQGGSGAHVNASHVDSQQQPPSHNQNQNVNPDQQGRHAQQAPQQVAQIPLLPNQQPRNVAVPAQVAQAGNAQNAPPAQAQAPAIAEELNIGAIAGHLWVVVRIVGFLWLFFGGSNVGYVRPFVIGVVAFLAYAAQQQGPIRRFGERIRDHLEGLLRPQEGAGQRGQDQGQNRNQASPEGRSAVQGRPADVATPANRVPRTRMEIQRAWARAQLLSVERALALFIASLWPGVGERHVEARERERRQREEAEARQQREQEERERLREEEEARVRAEEEAHRNSDGTAETVGLRSPRPSDHDEGLRERRSALVNDAQQDYSENGSTELKGKGKEPVRSDEDVSRGNATGADSNDRASHRVGED